jgi:diacylglycerol kinase family enzyme
VDGEFAGRLPAEIRIVPDAITLLACRSTRRANAGNKVAEV